MICPKCGMETSPLDNGPCLLCKTTHSGLEKVEPIATYPSTSFDINSKLNEVIEKVNRIMEVMNRR